MSEYVPWTEQEIHQNSTWDIIEDKLREAQAEIERLKLLEADRAEWREVAERNLDKTERLEAEVAALHKHDCPELAWTRDVELKTRKHSALYGGTVGGHFLPAALAEIDRLEAGLLRERDDAEYEIDLLQAQNERLQISLDCIPDAVRAAFVSLAERAEPLPKCSCRDSRCHERDLHGKSERGMDRAAVPGSQQ